MKITIKIGDQTHEVDHEDANVTFEQGLVVTPQASFNTAIENAKNSQKKATETEYKGKIAALGSDDEHFRSIATARGISLDDKNLPVSKDDPELLNRIKQQVIGELVTPLQAKVDTLTDQVVSGRSDRLMNRIHKAAPEAGVKESRLRTIFKGQHPEFIQSVATMFTFDEERDDFYFKDELGNPVYDGANYAGPDKLFVKLRKSDESGDYFEDRKPEGTKFGATGRSGQKTVSSQSMAQGDVDVEKIASGEITVV